jgi:DNA repair exonuclease SbcCD ATPase subunit
MAITVKYLEDLGVEKEVAEKIFAERSKEIEADKAKREKLETELKESKESLDNLSKEFEDLKANNASAEEYKSKYEAVIAENEAKAKQAEADRILAEKTENINKRFEAVVGEKTFSHNAIKADYLKKFGEAIEMEDNKSLSDEQIFHNLIKDDATAFTGVTAVKLQGGTPMGTNSTVYSSKEDIMKIKDATQRQNAIRENPQLFR